MSKKRTSSDYNPNDNTNEDVSGALNHHDDDTKRVKLISPSDTTLEDLPLELIHCIFVRAITAEVMEMNLAKSVWTEKADLVIGRLRTVCPLWSNILTSDFFLNELYRTLDRTEQTIRLEILHQSPIQSFDFPEMVSLRDELFLLVESEDVLDYAINVYDRDNLAKAKDVIDLEGLEPYDMVSCSVSNCLYVLNIERGNPMIVVRIKKEDEDKYTMSPFISGRWKPSRLAVASNGNLILYSIPNRHDKQTAKVVVYDASGVLQHNVKLPSEVDFFYKIIPRSNGNLVLVSMESGTSDRTKLIEIDTNGNLLLQYQSSIRASDKVCVADLRGQILIFEELNRFELLDTELNLLNVIGPQLDMKQLTTDFYYFSNLDHNSERNELSTVLNIFGIGFNSTSALYTFRFTEE